MDLTDLLRQAVDRHISDIFIVAGKPLCFKTGTRIEPADGERLLPDRTRALIMQIYQMANGRSAERLETKGDDDFSFSLKGVSRFRVSAYKQRGSLAAVIRVVALELPDPQALHIPANVLALADIPRGLLLVSGPSGCGKSTTLACMIDRINSTRSGHIITLEDPIEFLHAHKSCIVSQREIEMDTESYPAALRAALRQNPDVILIGELRDTESIAIALTAAETGHLVISTLHTLGAANSIDRLVDAFPPEQQQQVRMQLSMVLQAVVSQQLVPTRDGQEWPAFELMLCNGAVRNTIRDGRTHQLDALIFSGAAAGMVSMDNSLLELYRQGRITRAEAELRSLSPEQLVRRADELG
ncbi:MAG: PilT/PilU family type 4a pilus ATPase [Oscillospiraceae bacterium]|nr:PilT/PilU family type 4a pilus ATPase [Oscillospiraceae bacterium]